MAIKIGAKSYPDEVWDIMKNKEMAPLFHKHCVAGGSPENTAFLMALISGKKTAILYNAFIKEGSQFYLNLSGNLRKYMIHMGGVSDWDHAGWKKALPQARNEVVRLVDSNFLETFFRSEIFRKFVFSKSGKPEKAAKLLGIRDHKTLGDIIIAQVLGKTADAKKKMDALAKKEKLKDKSEALLKVLVGGGWA
ncbi:MAG: hypothetical protein AB8B85_17810 [Paracoccaceae bacterium]